VSEAPNHRNNTVKPLGRWTVAAHLLHALPQENLRNQWCLERLPPLFTFLPAVRIPVTCKRRKRTNNNGFQSFPSFRSDHPLSSFFLSVRFPLLVADPAVGSLSRSATWGWTDEEESADEEGDDLWVHPCVGCRCVRAAPGWFRWRPACADDGLWATMELTVGSELGLLDLQTALLRRHRWFAQMVGG